MYQNRLNELDRSNLIRSPKGEIIDNYENHMLVTVMINNCTNIRVCSCRGLLFNVLGHAGKLKWWKRFAGRTGFS